MVMTKDAGTCIQRLLLMINNLTAKTLIDAAAMITAGVSRSWVTAYPAAGTTALGGNAQGLSG